MMPLVKVVEHGQITLPADLCQELAIKEGDYLEAERWGDGVFLRLKSEHELNKHRKALKEEPKGIPSLDEIRKITKHVPSLTKLIAEGRDT